MSDKLTWIPFYTEFADKLLPFRDDRAALIERICAVYERIGVKLPKLESSGRPVDIDPFTVFGLFNKGVSDATRLKIIAGFKDEFGVVAPKPEDFDGIPVLNNLSATFYWFEGMRGDHDIDTLWDVLACALALAEQDGEQERQAFAQVFDEAVSHHGVKWNLTMGLFWIRPYAFINLDSRNRWYIGDQNSLNDECSNLVKSFGNDVPSGSDYLRMRDVCREAFASGDVKDGSTDFPTLSYNAWTVSERVNAEKAAQKDAAAAQMGEASMGDDPVRPVHYWVYSPGPFASKWDEFYTADIMAIGWGEIGDPSSFKTRSDLKARLKGKFGGSSTYANSALALWQFVHDMQPGDIVFAKAGKSRLVGRGVVTSEPVFDESREDEYRNVRGVEWTHRGSWEFSGNMATKTLTDITVFTDKVNQIEALFDIEDDSIEAEPPEVDYPRYFDADFLSEVYLPEVSYRELVALLKHKKNVILQGAPGVGKTFMAKRLAYSIMGVKDSSRVELIQFHQSYSYEDFIMGYRPNESGFELKTGAFYDFCKRAADDGDNEYFCIIDEVNRGNLSKIFGELFMLIEPDKRGLGMRLLYSNERFTVPPNVYLIGTMNTADRSLALMDFALRRRFAFFELEPGFDTPGFRQYQKSLASPVFDKLVSCVRQLNDAIASDESLGRGYRIGHSFFCGLDAEDPSLGSRLAGIVDYELVPLLREYWFDEPDKVGHWEQLLKGSVSAG